MWNDIYQKEKGIQQQSSIVEEEVEEEVKKEEAEPTFNVAHEGATEGEARPSQVRRIKIDKLQRKFDEFKAETNSNFVVVKQQLQNCQSETSANFEFVINLLESLKAEF